MNHYRRGDPETGIALMLISLIIFGAVFWAILFSAAFDWGPFA